MQHFESGPGPFLFLDIATRNSDVEISSIQAFETSLLMAMHNRWVAAIVSSVNAIETCLKFRFPLDQKLAEFIDSACDSGVISRGLHDILHELRKSRNQFVHEKISPRDNQIAAYAFFTKVVPCVRTLFLKIFEFDINESFLHPQIPFALKEYRRGLSKLQVDSHNQNISFDTTVFQKILSNFILIDIGPAWVKERMKGIEIEKRRFKMVDEEIKMLQKYENLADSWDEFSILSWSDGNNCPAYPCRSSLSLVSDAEPDCTDENPYHYVTEAKCLLCGLRISDKFQLEIFVNPMLTPEFINEEHARRGLETNRVWEDVHVAKLILYRSKLPLIEDESEIDLDAVKDGVRNLLSVYPPDPPAVIRKP